MARIRPLTRVRAGFATVSGSGTVGEQLPAWLTTLALDVGEWAQISGTALSDVTVTGAPTGRENIIDAWNGACGDQVNSVYWMLACGGHGDYGGNEVYKLDLTQATPAWVVARGVSSPLPQSASHGSDGRPVSSHTYQQQYYCSTRERAMRVGVGSMYSDATDDYAVDGFNPATNDWDEAGTWPDITTTDPAGMQDFGCVIDPLTGDIYSTCIHSGSYTLRRLAFSSNTWSSVSGVGNGRFATGAWDTTRNRGLMRMSSGTIFVTTGGGGTSTATFDGSAPGQYNALWYCESRDTYMWRATGSGGGISEAPADSLETTTFSTTGGASVPARTNGAHNSMQYFPNLGGALYIPAYDADVWFLKIHEVA
jgi:hypothetical protein